jgi:hypothetical protein
MANARSSRRLEPGWNRKTRVARIIPGINGNSLWARRMKELMVDGNNDLGGPDNVSSSEKNLIRRAATLSGRSIP